MKILVIGGGVSPERDVSLRSAKAVVQALRVAGFNIDEADTKDGYDFLDKVGPETIVFPILHGAGGEDGVIQTELESRHLPYLGTDSKASAICFDKGKTRAVLADTGLSIAKGDTVNQESYQTHELGKQPHVLKVTTGGSSIGTYIVRDPNNINQQKVSEVFALGNEAVIEELVEGIEITVPIFDTKALPVIEIRPPESSEFDYENKYNGATQEICPPVSINTSLQSEAQSLAERAHLALKCRHLSRVDMIVRADGSMVILEVNTIPGMTDQSLYPKSAQVAGMSFPDLMKQFVKIIKRDI